MVRLTTCGDAFEARVLAARLGADGIVWSLRGGHDGPLAVGAVEVLVAADDYEVARELLAAADDPTDGVEAPAPPASGVRRAAVLAAVVVLVVLFVLARAAAPV
jgi:hypothetical protein